jgi:hypothetical protein
VLTANQGVDVSNGRVAKPFELFPALFDTVPRALLRSALSVPIAPPPRTDELKFFQHRCARRRRAPPRRPCHAERAQC